MKHQQEVRLRGIPHEERILTFFYPAFVGTFGEVASEIDAEKLKRPTAGESVSLAYDYLVRCQDFLDNQKSPNDYKGEREITEIIEEIVVDYWMWGYTGRLWVPKSAHELSDGVFFEDNPQVAGDRIIMNIENLIKKLEDSSFNQDVVLFSKDKKVRFVRFGFKTDLQTSDELAKNPYKVGEYGSLECAEKLAEIDSVIPFEYVVPFNIARIWDVREYLKQGEPEISKIGCLGAVDCEGMVGRC